MCKNLVVLVALVGALPVDGQVTWVKQQPGTPVPKNALLAGTEEGTDNDGLRWYICRVVSKEGARAGKGGTDMCNVAFGTQTDRSKEFELAVAPTPGKWAPPKPAFEGALSAGKAAGKDVYVCRGVYKDQEKGFLGTKTVSHGMHAGQTSEGGPCLVEFGRKVISIKTYEVYYPVR